MSKEKVLVRAALPLRSGQVVLLLKELVLVYGHFQVRNYSDAERDWLECYQDYLLVDAEPSA